MRSEKDIFIAELSQHLSSNAGGTTQKPKFKRTKFLGKISPLGLTLFAVAIAAGVLISSFFTVYFVTMDGALEVTGTEAPLFYWDNTVEFIGDTCARPLDVSAMDAGDIETFPHNVLNADAGYWQVTFDLSDVTYTDPMSPEFGFYFSVIDYAVDGVPCTLDKLVIGPGEKAEFSYRYEIDHEMVTPDLPIDCSIGVTISAYTDVVNCVDDHVTSVGLDNHWFVLANDQTGLKGSTITAITQTASPGISISIHADGQSLDAYVDGSVHGSFSSTYTITSALGVSDTGTVFITVP